MGTTMQKFAQARIIATATAVPPYILHQADVAARTAELFAPAVPGIAPMIVKPDHSTKRKPAT